MSLDFSRVSAYSPLLVKGTVTTLELTLFSVLLGTVFGFITALFKMSRFKLLRALGNIYVELIRGTPLLVQLYIVYYGLPQERG